MRKDLTEGESLMCAMAGCGRPERRGSKFCGEHACPFCSLQKSDKETACPRKGCQAKLKTMKVRCQVCRGDGFTYECPDPEDLSREFKVGCRLCSGAGMVPIPL